jgi:hypothetical protein
MGKLKIFSNKKDARTDKGLSRTAKAAVEKNPGQGLNCGPLTETVPIFDRAKGEKVIKNKNNSWIVLGRDRPASKASGNGGAGHGKCGMIDIVVGRLASSVASENSDAYVSPSFSADAARIYICQKTNIDQHFGICEGYVGLSQNRSAIGMKADSIRIMARQGIKIVSSMPGPPSTAGASGQPKSRYGIDLISGNYGGPNAATDTNGKPVLQPIPRGEYLEECLKEIVKLIEGNSKIMSNFIRKQMEFNWSIATHTHLEQPMPVSLSTPLGIKYASIMPSQLIHGAIPSSWKNPVNASAVKLNYLTGPISNMWINSRVNRTT